MAKSSSDSKAETSPESTPVSEIQGEMLEEIRVLEHRLAKQVSRLSAQGEYNVDAADNLIRSRALLKLTGVMRVLLSKFDLAVNREDSP